MSHEFNRYVSFNFVGSPDKALLERFQLKETPAMRIMYAMPTKDESAGGENDPKAAGQDGNAGQNLQFQMVPWSMEMNGQVPVWQYKRVVATSCKNAEAGRIAIRRRWRR